MTCPHAKPIGKHMQCALIARTVFPSEGKPHNPCATCRAEWTDGQPPTCESLTPTLVQILPSRGIGDSIAKITHATGIDRAAKAIFGKNCGCQKRQKAWNEAIPYKVPEKANGG